VNQKTKKYLKTAAKVLFTLLALWIVYRKIDLDKTGKLLASVGYAELLLATFFFIASKVVSSIRLNVYFKSIGTSLSEKYNLRLYALGMFYNLFLPGGIGGDGYKVYLLNKNYNTSVKSLIAATLIDRVSGLMALLFLLLILASVLIPFDFLNEYDWIIYLGIIIGYPIYYLLNSLFFKSFLSKILTTSIYSVLVQGLQLISAYFILKAIGVTIDQHLSYQVMFLLSSIVAVLPFTVGGVGARELTFILGHEYLGIDKNVAVAFSLLFFLITAIVSLSGAFISLKPDENVVSENRIK